MPEIFLIDDSPDLRHLIAKALRNEDYVVHIAENGKDAIEKIKTIPKCVILLDLMMPVMDGYQFMEWKNSNSEFTCWPTIILSASARTEAPSGASAFLKKPVDLNELLDLIEKIKLA